MEKPVEKNKEYVVDIIDNGYEGEGIAKIDNFTIFIPGAIKGEKIKILIVKVLSSHAFGKIIEILAKSAERVKEDCYTYKRCGGCNLRHINYQTTLKMKRNTVQSLVNKTLNKKVVVKDTIGMENPYNYRNKAQYPIGLNKEGKPIVGVFANRTHEIIPFEACKIQKPISEKIARFICDYIKEKNISVYNEKTCKGIFRHIVIKVGVATNEIMCILVINSDGFKEEIDLVEKLKTKFTNIKTIVKNINKRNTNVILGSKNVTLYGEGYIFDKLDEFKFKISPMSFYQVNPTQTEKLYNLAIQKAELTGNEVVFDLYCGIGTIGIFAAKHAKQVYGIEIVEEAIKDAKQNAKINNIDNINFYAGDVEELLFDLIDNKKIVPDVIIVDPPRKGLDGKSINNIMRVAPEKVIYISCNPATLVRDLKLLEDKYEIKEIQPVDMFPFTSHVECCALMTLKDNL